MFLKLPPWILFLDKVRFKYIIPNILFLTVIQHILEKHSSDISVSRFDLMLVFKETKTTVGGHKTEWICLNLLKVLERFE